MANKLAIDEFLECIEDLVQCPDVISMHEISQHVDGISCLDHCIFVSYISFLICKKFNMDYKSATRAALLHDLYLCDWDTTDIGVLERLLIHPTMAVNNARIHNISPLEEDIILNHMWPLTFKSAPKHRESVVVNFADKLCATAEVLRIYKIVGIGKKLVSFNKRRVPGV